MRGKKRKILRVIAEQATVGLPVRDYFRRAPNPQKPHKTTVYMVKCTRLAIKRLKKQYKAVKHVQRIRNSRQAGKNAQAEAHA